MRIPKTEKGWYAMKRGKRLMAKLLTVAVVLMLAMVLMAPAAQAATPQQIEQAIDDGLAWLAAQQNPDGSWETNYQVGHTGLAVLKFETHAVFAGMSPFDPAYAYHQNVIDGLNYIFTQTYNTPIPAQPAGNPDTNGNGIGVYCDSGWGRPTYETAIALMAISASTEPGRVVGAGSEASRTYADVAQDMADWLAFGQCDGGNERGGWGYGANDVGWADNSNAGYATLGLGYAEALPPWGFGLTVPPFVFSELNIWIDYVQNDVNGDTNDGGSGYSDPNEWVNILKTGNLLQQMSLFGDTIATPRVQDAVDYMERHWNDANQDPGWKGPAPHYQACFTTMKGFQSLGIETIDVGGPLNWYDDMADAIVTTQNPDGSWPGDPWGGPVLATAWAMLTLEKAAPPALAVVPPFDVNPPGTDHTVTAVYKIAGVPQQGMQIDFEVIAGPNTGKSGSDNTSAVGEASFTYTGDGGIGTDTIEARAIDPATGATLISAQVSKEWKTVVPPQVPGITGWGIIATAVMLAVLIPLALRRRVFAGSR